VHRAAVGLSVCHLQQEVSNDRLAGLTFRHRRWMCCSSSETPILFYLCESSMQGQRLCPDHIRQGTNGLGVLASYCFDRIAANLLNESLSHRRDNTPISFFMKFATWGARNRSIRALPPSRGHNHCRESRACSGRM
jgi:hypothetical protein